MSGQIKGQNIPLLDRVATALHDFTHARASMHIPPEATDVDMVLSDCREEIEKLNKKVQQLRQDFRASLTLNRIQSISIDRSKRWHGDQGLEGWSAMEWAGAMCGEAGEVSNAIVALLMTHANFISHVGEAANMAKKLKRVEGDLLNIQTTNDLSKNLGDAGSYQIQVCREVADVMLYGVLLMARVGCDDPESFLRDVFNRKSEEYGFPERM